MMNGDQLGIEIAQAVMHPKATPEAQASVIEHYQKIANAIVDHITANAEVPAGIGLQAGAYSGATIEAGKVE